MTNRGLMGLDVRWLVSGLTLLGIVGVQAFEPFDALLPSAEAVPLAATRDIGDLPLIGAQEQASAGAKVELVSAIAGRSLFTKSRGTVQAQSARTVEATSVQRSREAPPIELIGTLLSQRADVALVIEGSDRQRRLQVGDIVSDWMIVRIERDGLTLKQDDALAPVALR